MKLFPHQIKALELTQNQNRVAFFLDMGLGKTFVGSEKLSQLNTNVNLLVCQKSKISDWVEHFTQHHPDFDVYDITNSKGFENFFKSNSKKIGIINYELSWRREELLKLKDFTLMLDESSLIQNSKAKQTKFILKLKSKNVILLSGTPTSGKYENLWTQAKLLGWNIKKSEYDSRYINWDKLRLGGQYVNVVRKSDPYKNVDELKLKLRENGAVFMKTEECFDLPEQIFTEILVDKPKIYDTFIKQGVVELKDRDLVGDTPLTKRLYARQICSQYNEHKLNAFKDLLNSTNDRLIVFYNFDGELEQLQDICRHAVRPVSIVNGKYKDLSAYESESDSVTLIQYQAGAMGLNLQKSNKIIYFSLPERSELFEQSKKRTHRIGQQSTCYYYLLMAKNTVDVQIYEALKQKKDFTDELFKECIK